MRRQGKEFFSMGCKSLIAPLTAIYPPIFLIFTTVQEIDFTRDIILHNWYHPKANHSAFPL